MSKIIESTVSPVSSPKNVNRLADASCSGNEFVPKAFEEEELFLVPFN